MQLLGAPPGDNGAPQSAQDAIVAVQGLSGGDGRRHLKLVGALTDGIDASGHGSADDLAGSADIGQLLV